MYMVASERMTPSASVNGLHFTLSRGEGRLIVVSEAQGRAGGAFADLSSAMRFIETQCEAAGTPVQMRFDASLAMIRAAGA